MAQGGLQPAVRSRTTSAGSNSDEGGDMEADGSTPLMSATQVRRPAPVGKVVEGKPLSGTAILP